jgi:hypothetical protein
MRPVTAWDRHKLADEPAPMLDLSVGQHVTAKVDLARVPAGTEGAVILADGFAWRRYRVQFENGVELAFLDGRHLEAGKKPLMQRLRRGRR